jgi:type I restriction enzyme S subunit
MNNYIKTILSEVAEVRLCNVDKKTHIDEIEIRLCNYMDVYKNPYINSDISKSFMVASCNKNELENFILKEGQVAITKDSEKRDDIGISTYIAESFEDVVLGYHTALITPKKGALSGKFLNYWFNTKFAKVYFENNAGGSGQRCTLPIDIIKSIPLRLPVFKLQERIASIFYDIDSKIELNNRINAELEAMAKTIYDYWFVQFDFPDINGKPYKSSGGKMVWNEELKREIPEGWEVGKLGDIAELVRGVTYSANDIKNQFANDVIPILRATNINGNVIDLNNLVYVSKQNVSNAQLLNKYDILITMSSGSKEHIGKNGFFYFESEASFGAFCAKIVANAEYRYYLYSFTQSEFMFTTIKNECLGTNINNLNGSLVKGFRLIVPPNELIDFFNDKVNSLYDKIGNNLKENQKLVELRDWLLPMLMNGQVKIQ